MSKITFNIDTDLDEQIEKCEKLIRKYEELEGHSKQLHFINAKELAEMRGCSISVARKILSLPDMATEDFGKERVVLLEALKEWYMTKRSKKDYE